MIQYINIAVETDDNGDIIRVGLVNECCDCTSSYWTAKTALSETSGLPADAPTKDHIAKITSELSHPYLLTKQKLATESGLADFRTVEEHIAKIKEKARLNGADVAAIKHIAWCEGANRKRQELQDILSDHSDLAPSNEVSDHIAAIKLKAYDEGYDKGWRDKQADIQKRMKQFEEAIKSE